MEENTSRNYVQLCGVIAAAPKFSHESRGESFYTFPLEVARLSGTLDTLNIIMRKELIGSLELNDSEKLYLSGELRSFNNKSGEGAKLVITVFAKEACLTDEPDLNEVLLTGTLCKKPQLRTTPMGRDICDMMLAVNRRYGRSDYLPCIAWGQNARRAAEWDTGTVITLSGRIQSRDYIKMSGAEAIEKRAFEVSVTELEEYL